MRISKFAALAAAILLSACTTLPKVPYDRTLASDVKSIGIITPKFPDGPTVFLASTVGRSFGLIGALIDAGMQADRQSKFQALLQQENFSTQERFVDSIADALREAGYTVSVIPVTRDGTDFVSTYPTAEEPKVDAYLDMIADGYGYGAAGIGWSTPYRPVFAVRARLVRARDSSVLMQDMVSYNPIGPRANVITIAPDPVHRFETFDSLIGNPKGAVSGLQAATEQSAFAVAKLLR